MFLRCTTRKKAGKEHHYWSLVENKRVGGGRVVQRYMLYLGEINSSEQEAWRKSIEIFEEGKARPRTVALFPEERIGPVEDARIVRLRLDDIALRRPRQWGACWLGCQLYEKLGLDGFWAQRLPPNRKGTRWDLILKATHRFLKGTSASSATAATSALIACRCVEETLTALPWQKARAGVAVKLLPEAGEQLTHVEEAFKNLKGDLALRPIYHQKEDRIEAHIFVAFLAYCLHVTLGRQLRDLAPGLTPRSVLEKFSAMQMIDVHLPTSDGREVVLTRYTQPEPELELLLRSLKLKLPPQPPPKITASALSTNPST